MSPKPQNLPRFPKNLFRTVQNLSGMLQNLSRTPQILSPTPQNLSPAAAKALPNPIKPCPNGKKPFPNVSKTIPASPEPLPLKLLLLNGFPNINPHTARVKEILSALRTPAMNPKHPGSQRPQRVLFLCWLGLWWLAYDIGHIATKTFHERRAFWRDDIEEHNEAFKTSNISKLHLNANPVFESASVP